MEARAFAPLRNPDFFKLWVGQFVSVVGDKINQIALAVLVYAATGSMLQMGIMLGVSALPAVLFGVFAGVFVDRWDRRRTMVAADLVRAGLVAAIPFVVRFGVGWAYAIAFGVATVSLLFEPAKRSLIVDLVPRGELMAANSLDNASSAIAELAGLAFGGVLIALLDTRLAFVIDAATYVISALAILAIAFREPARDRAGEEPRSTGLMREAAAGLRHAAGLPVLRSLALVYVTAAAAAGAAITIMNALALRTFNAGAPGLAALDAAITVGILIGSYLVARGGSGAPGQKFLWGLTAFAVLLAILAAAPGIVVAAGVLVLTGIANMYFFIPMQSIVQTAPDEAMRGRVISVMTSANRVLMVLGLVGAGALLERTGTGTMLVATALLVLVAALAGWTMRPLREA
ncbi:MAG TPA: MFS transporter [Coriobacteriia bacterium]